MANRFWRCYGKNCTEDAAGRLGFDFWAEKPTCPKCGASAANPQHRAQVVPLVVTHFLVEDPKGKIVGNGSMLRVACSPAMTKIPFPPVGQASLSFSVVTCPLCKATPEWMGSLVDNQVHLDYSLELDLQKMAYTVAPEDGAKADETIKAPVAN
jgi:hypothetical protein